MASRRPARAGAAARGRVPLDQVMAWLAASCAAQGVPLQVTDTGVIDTVAALLRGGVRAAGWRVPGGERTVAQAA